MCSLNDVAERAIGANVPAGGGGHAQLELSLNVVRSLPCPACLGAVRRYPRGCTRGHLSQRGDARFSAPPARQELGHQALNQALHRTAHVTFHRRTDADPDCSGSARSERRQLKVNWDGPCAHVTRSRRPAFAPVPAFETALPRIPAPPTRRSSRVPALSSRTAPVPISVFHEPSVPRPRPNMG